MRWRIKEIKRDIVTHGGSGGYHQCVRAVVTGVSIGEMTDSSLVSVSNGRNVVTIGEELIWVNIISCASDINTLVSYSYFS